MTKGFEFKGINKKMLYDLAVDHGVDFGIACKACDFYRPFRNSWELISDCVKVVLDIYLGDAYFTICTNESKRTMKISFDYLMEHGLLEEIPEDTLKSFETASKESQGASEQSQEASEQPKEAHHEEFQLTTFNEFLESTEMSSQAGARRESLWQFWPDTISEQLDKVINEMWRINDESYRIDNEIFNLQRRSFELNKRLSLVREQLYFLVKANRTICGRAVPAASESAALSSHSDSAADPVAGSELPFF